MGPPDEHPDLIESARAKRREKIAELVRSQRQLEASLQTSDLRDAIVDAQERLERMRLEGGFDRAPIAVVSDALQKLIDATPLADPSTRTLARALLADFESEIELRLARKDAEVAKLRGLMPKAESPRTPTLDQVEVRGLVRWEAAPKWKNGGAFILWVGEQPKYVLRLTVGARHPLPDLKGSADGKARLIVARQPGERVFGLPALDVLEIKD